MSDETTSSSSNEPFDLDRLRELVEMMETHGLTEVSLRRGDEKWRLRRGAHEAIQMVPANPVPQPAGAAVQPTVTAETAADKPADDDRLLIKSPTIGTFYTAATPDDPPFVQIGSKVQPDSIVCIVEAMKVFNQIPAEVSGTIAEILVNNGDPVEFGLPLFRVSPN